MPDDKIRIYGASQHNLHNVNLEIPRNRLVVFCGVSGSGKSSMAFDTIYAEGQRRYVESLSTYARHLLGEMDRPEVDHIEGLSPAIAIDQKTIAANPRSTVATATDIYDYLRVLFARVGQPHCPVCGKPIHASTITNIVDQIMAMPEGSKILLLAPVHPAKDDDWYGVLRDARRAGFVRVRIDGQVHMLDKRIDFGKEPEHVEIVIDRVAIKPDIRSRLADSVETTLQHGDNVIIVAEMEGADYTYSTRYACAGCDVSIRPLTPQMFSFNNPQGMCPTCEGIGTVREVDPKLLLDNPTKSINAGVLKPYGSVENTHIGHLLHGLAAHYSFSLDTPWKNLPQAIRDIILFGSGEETITFQYSGRDGRDFDYSQPFEGLVSVAKRRIETAETSGRKGYYEKFITDVPCPECLGARLSRESLAVTVGGLRIADITAMNIAEAEEFFADLQLGRSETFIAAELVKEIRARLQFMLKVGVGYLTLDRAAPSLSRGEAQRIRLATQIGSGLAGVMYILDEPSIGLHQRDHSNLLDTIISLRDLGNSVIVVEHDPETMRAADHIVEFGPGAGTQGGQVVYTGDVPGMLADPRSTTGAYLSGRLQIQQPPERRKPTGEAIRILGANAHNLRDIDVEIPIGLFTCVTGVSGSGKSSLIHHILYRALRRQLHHSSDKPGEYRAIVGAEAIDKIIHIDQNPIGRTPRSNPATYAGVFGPIRELFSQTPEARVRGYKQDRFSFNIVGGRCEACEGKGTRQVEMDFLPDVYVTCEECKGLRYNRETLEVRYKGKNIAEVLALTVADALNLFDTVPKIKRVLQTLCDVGLEYLTLGQPATTLSAGEAQRIKLARELARPGSGATLYILDEPTTGLHFADIDKLVQIINRLVDQGNTAVVIEHNLDVIKTADWVVDLGPDGGEGGGRLLAAGTPYDIMACHESYTGRYLKDVL